MNQKLNPTKNIRVCAASTSARWGELERNLAKVVVAAERAADAGARLLLLPECCLTGGNWCTGARAPTVREAALPLDAPPLRKLLEVARRRKIVLAVGLYEQLGDSEFICQALLGPRGLIGVYRKVHEGALSSRDAEPFPVFDLGFARVGISICFDNCFPEAARILALKGAQVLLAPFASLPLSRRGWRDERLTALRARALDNHIFVLSASQAMPRVAGKPPEWGYSGICCAINPRGQVLAESRGPVGRPQSVTVDLDPAEYGRFFLEHSNNLLARRIEAYRELLDPKVQRAYAERWRPRPRSGRARNP